MKLLVIILCLASQIAEKQQELNQLKSKLNTVRQEIKDLEKQKVGTLAHIEKIDEGINLTIQYIDDLTAQENREKSKISELEKEIARLESKMRLKKGDMRMRIVRLYKWKPFYKRIKTRGYRYRKDHVLSDCSRWAEIRGCCFWYYHRSWNHIYRRYNRWLKIRGDFKW